MTIIIVDQQMIEAGAIALRNVTGNRSGKGKPWARAPERAQKL